MTPQQLEDFAQRIALATVDQIQLTGDISLMNISAEAWATRSRNLAKLWASKAPIPQEEAEAAYAAELTEISNEAAQQSAMRRKVGRPALK